MKNSKTFDNYFVPVFFSSVLLLIFSCSQNKRRQEKGITNPDNLVAPQVTILANLPDKSKPKITYLEKTPKPLTILRPKLSVTHSFIDSITHTVISPEAQGTGFFTKYGTEHGIPLINVGKGYCDKAGNIWFATWGRGVSRYDGKKFTNFTSAQGLGYNAVETIIEDNAGNLWFGTPGGATRYDGNSFVNFTVAQGLASNKVKSIVQDKAGNLWFGTADAGISRYDGKSFVNFTTAQGLASNSIHNMIEDKAGDLWLSTNGRGLSRYDGRSFKNFTKADGLANNHVNSMGKDKAGNLWFGTGDGVSHYDGKSFTNFTKAQGLINNNVFCITADKIGNIWFGTDSGTSRYDGKSFLNFTEAQGLAKNSITDITEDKSGNLWFSTTGGGVSRYDGKFIVSFTKAQGLTNNVVWDITEDKAGSLWFGIDLAGALRYDGKSFASVPDLKNYAVISITKDKNGNIWFGTNTGGVWRYDGESLVNFTTAQGLANNGVFANNAVNSITEDKAGNIWFGTYGGGISRFDGKSFTNFTTVQGLAGNDIHTAIMDKSGNLWFGATGQVCRYDGKSFTNYNAAQGLAKNAITNILEDQAGNLWFGTFGEGVFRFDGKSFTNFTTVQGLADNTVYSAVTDKQGNIVFGTNLGLTMLKGFIPASSGKEFGEEVIQPSNKLTNGALKNYEPVFEIYNQSTGYPIKDINNSGGNGAMICDTNDIIWAGTGDKLVRFDYAAKQKNIDPPSVFIQGIKINNEDVIWHNLISSKSRQLDSLAIINEEVTLSGNVLSDSLREHMRWKFRKIQFDGITKWYPLPENLILPYEHNNVTFEFAAIEPARPYLVKYQYQLEGYDNNWSPPANKTSATYGNIYEGTYSFKLRAQSPDGIWSLPLIYIFRVLPPWYRTWWAYSLYLALFIEAMRRFIRWRVRILKKQKAFLEEKLEMQNAVMTERSRISRELHDEIGATLSGIAMYSHLTKEQIKAAQPSQVENSLTIIQQSAVEMVNKLNDIVWLLNPDQNSLEEIIQRLEVFATEMAMAKSMQLKINLPVNLSGHGLKVETRHHIYLFCKEAINNAVKYSNGTLLELRVKKTGDSLQFSVRDNGNGFDVERLRRGNGLNNMQQRADEIGAKLTIQSKTGGGCLVSMEINIT